MQRSSRSARRLRDDSDDDGSADLFHALLYDVSVAAVQSSISYGTADSLVNAISQTTLAAGLTPALQLRGIETHVTSGLGEVIVQAQYATPADAASFFAYVTSTSGLNAFVSAAIANGGLLCGATVYINDTYADRNVSFACTPDNSSPIVTPGLRSLCCAPPPFPPLPPAPPPPLPSPPAPPVGSGACAARQSTHLKYQQGQLSCL